MAALMAAGLLPLATVLALYLLWLEPRLQQEILLEHEQLALEMGAVLNRNVFERYADVRAFAQNPDARDAAAWRTPRAGPLVAAMNAYVDIYDDYRLMMLVSPSGEVLAVSSGDARGRQLDNDDLYARDMRSEPWFQDAGVARLLRHESEGEAAVAAPCCVPFIAGLYGDEGYVLPFVAPVRGENGRVIALWANFFDFSKVGATAKRMIEQRQRVAPSARRFQIFGPAGELIYDSLPGALNPRPAGLVELSARRKPGAPTISGVIGREAVAVATAPPEQDFPGLGWTVVTREETSEAFSSIREMRNTVVVLLGLTAVATLAFGAWIGQRVSEPILQLAVRMRQLAGGETQAPIPQLERSDDIGEMARALAVFRQAVADKDHAAAELAKGKAATDIERRRLRDIIEALGDGFFAIDRDWRMTLGNSVAERYGGVERDEVLGSVLWDLFPQIKGTEFAARLRGVMERREVVNFDALSILHPQRWLHVRLFPTPEGVGVWFRDVTEQRQAAAALRESEERRALAMEAADIGTWDYNVPTGEVVWDERCRALLGLPLDATDYPTFLAQIHPADRERVDNEVRQALDPVLGRARYATEFRVGPHGEPADERWIAATGRAQFEHGRPVRMLGLLMDVTERKRSEVERELLVNELNHRVKNSLATVQAIAQQTLKADADPASARARFTARLIALARAHDVLTRRAWEGADLGEVVADAVAPFQGDGPARVSFDGPPVRLAPKSVLALSMALFELGSNAVEHGALGTDGTVTITWTVEPGRLRLVWRERGGPPVIPRARKGFGSRLIEQGLAGELGAAVFLDFPPHGVVCRIDLPLPGSEPA